MVIKRDEFIGVGWIPYKYQYCDVCQADCNPDSPNPKAWLYRWKDTGEEICWKCREERLYEFSEKIE